MLFPTEQIDLWCAFPHEIRDDLLLKQYRELLADDEKRQMDRFHFSEDRHRYLVRRALVRSVLSRYVHVEPREWRFTPNAFGKPAIANDIPAAQNISFNLSHTHGLIILGITSGSLLGVDVENIFIRPAPIEVARDFFTGDECADILAAPLAMRDECFFRYWTLKESYIKARGMGLSIPLNRFGFHHQQHRLKLFVHPEMDDLPTRWQFRQFRLTHDHLAAVCVERGKHVERQIIMHHVVPLASHMTFDGELLWRTE